MIRVDKVFFKTCRQVVVGGEPRNVFVNKVVRVVFFEKFEMWAAPDILGMAKYSWHDLRKHVMRKLAAEARAEVVRKFTPPRMIDISPKSATEVFG